MLHIMDGTRPSVPSIYRIASTFAPQIQTKPSLIGTRWPCPLASCEEAEHASSLPRPRFLHGAGKLHSSTSSEDLRCLDTYQAPHTPQCKDRSRRTLGFPSGPRACLCTQRLTETIQRRLSSSKFRMLCGWHPQRLSKLISSVQDCAGGDPHIVAGDHRASCVVPRCRC